MEKVDITIIGAGVIGLAIAAEIARPDLSIFILEKNPSHGEGISSRNSEVIHGGMYYPEGSLKASLCVNGNKMLYDIAAKNNIPHKITGKLIVAVKPEEIEELERLHANGRKNGLTSTSIISKKQIAKIEPNVQAEAALYSPDTGIISVHDLMNYYLTKALNSKAQIVCHTKVVRIEKEPGRYRIFTHNAKSEIFEFSSAIVINAAGLESDTIANMAGGNYHLHYCKGDYCSLSGVKPGVVQRLIYPVPAKNRVGLGVHLTLDLNGRFKLGPDTTYIDRKEDYKVAPEKASDFYHSARKFLPFLKEENVHSDMSGIRPKLQGPNDDFRDFVIKEDAPGFINLVGIESPGLTASPAIALYVKAMLF
ncbi:MAG: NAD(P)/FAD-dependent oxidoreductase [Deltaproteobacteria bacterium]|nr:NAD(P)/FAD-dependent oxidoreductase [Deltaproteobacteria bacterium]